MLAQNKNTSFEYFSQEECVLFIDKVEQLLKEKHIQKKVFLSDVGLAKNSFVNWRERKTIPNGATLQKIADYFGVTVDYLLGKETDKPAGVPDEMWAELCKDEKRKALALWIMSLPDDDLARAEKLLDAAKLFPPDHS